MEWEDVEENYFYELVRKSEKSNERRVAENANIMLDAEMAHDIEPAWTYLVSALEMHNAKLDLFTQENVDGKCCIFIKLLPLWRKRRCSQATGEGLDEGLHHCDEHMRDLPEKYCHDLVRKPLPTGSRKTDKISLEILSELSSDRGKLWKNLGRALGVREAAIDQADEENQNLLDKCYNILLLWRKRLRLQATYEALEAGLCHGSVQREDLAKKYCHDADSLSYTGKHKNTTFTSTHIRTFDNVLHVSLDPNAPRCSCHACFGFLDPPAQKTSNELTKLRLSTLSTHEASSELNV